MTVIVDTNVLAYYLLRTEPYFAEVREFWRETADVWAPDSWRAEFVNVLWLAVRAGVIDRVEAERALFLAERLVARTVSSRQLVRSSLRLASTFEHAAYDTLFVALAVRKNAPLVTCDRALLRKFPEWTTRPSEYRPRRPDAEV